MEIEVVGCGGASAGSGSGGGGGGGEVGGGESRRGGGMYLVWENLRVMLPSKGSGPTKRLLDGLNGYAEPGKIMAIMGPSGSGKSTLLDALAGRLSRNVVMAGNVMLNGKKSRLEYGGAAYVTQENTLLGTLTIRETITYSANLRLPRTKTKEQIEEIVEETIVEMGLQDCADRLIGNWHLRGISGGEKKRLSIALEILTRPNLLFLDEPSSGLDSASAFFVVQTLRNIARDGRTVISSIHQPSSEVFALFDSLYLLSSGEAVYFGEAKMAVEFFAEAGLPCPRKRNPSDHFLRCINSDFDRVTKALIGSQRFSLENLRTGESSDSLETLTTAEIKAILVKKYSLSNYALRTRARIEEILAMKEPVIETKPEKGPNWWKQLMLLTLRSFTNMRRDIGYYWVRLAIYIALSICVGTIFYDVGTNYSAILARGSCGAFISGFMTFMSIGGFPSFIEELKVFYVEKLNGHYGVGVYAVSNFLSSFPFLFTMALSTAGIIYPMVKFTPGFWHFTYSFLDLMASIATVESTMMAIATLVPNFIMGLVSGAAYIGILLLTSGYFRLLPELPKVFWRYPVSYINFGAWGLQGAYKNDMLGLEFDPLEAGAPKIKGEYVLKTILGMDIDHSKWWDLAAVVAILISFRFLFYAILKFRERTLPVFRRFQAKRTLENLKKRPSFRKKSPFPSKRHQPLHSLSSQDGFSSPIQ